ncbi:MAG: methylthioxylose transferase [Pseudonocardiales bacterium]|nr:methylthioxylose transferase [Pseudonocardiales bacterium]
MQAHGSRPSRRSPTALGAGWRADLVVVAAAVGLVVAAAVVGRRLLAEGVDLTLPFPPLLAQWLPHLGPGTPLALVVAAVVVTRGPGLAERMAWRPLVAVVWAATTAWTLGLALVDGWQRGVVDRLTSADEYLHDVPRAPALSLLLREFAAHILTSAVDPGQKWFWTTHVGAHPPGAFLVFVVLDRIGLGGGGPAGLLVIAIGASGAAAILVAARALGSETVARRAAPYAVLFPGAVWVGVSADGLFAGWLAWGIALLAIAVRSTGRRAGVAALAGGLLLGGVVYLSYGLVLGGLLAVAVLVHGRVAPTQGGRWWWTVGFAATGAALVVAAFTLAGFSWVDGYSKVRVIYAASIAAARPYSYFVWANLAAVVCAIGPAGIAGLRRIATRPVGPYLVVAAAVAAMLVADLSGMSKAEVERIWLPFSIWTCLACAELPHPRRWLAAQAVLALLVNHLLLTVW